MYAVIYFGSFSWALATARLFQYYGRCRTIRRIYATKSRMEVKILNKCMLNQNTKLHPDYGRSLNVIEFWMVWVCLKCTLICYNPFQWSQTIDNRNMQKPSNQWLETWCWFMEVNYWKLKWSDCQSVRELRSTNLFMISGFVRATNSQFRHRNTSDRAWGWWRLGLTLVTHFSKLKHQIWTNQLVQPVSSLWHNMVDQEHFKWIRSIHVKHLQFKSLF